MNKPKLRCAVYTRKSSEEGLEQEFNSLHAQREACSAFVVSQAGLGWKLVPDAYDDGGISGGTMERPALQRLLQDIRDGRIDVVVVYKIDRLTRSLMDFSRMVEIFDASAVSFVSVTQAFNTTTSMGRLTLNVLLSFAQFEREVTAERIRDKIAASKKKGMWMGGRVPLGYRAENRKLAIDPEQAERVRHLFHRYLELGSVREVVEEDERACAEHDGGAASITTNPVTSDEHAGSRWHPLTRGQLYGLLANPLYLGKLRHKDQVHDGEHEAIVDAATFAEVQQRLKDQGPDRRSSQSTRDVHLLGGVLYDETGDRLSPTHATNHGKRYRYYVSSRLTLGHGKGEGGGWRVAAGEIERIVDEELCRILSDEAQLVDWVRQLGSADCIAKALSAGQTLRSAEPDQQRARQDALGSSFRRIVLAPGSIRFEVDSAALISLLGVRPLETNIDAGQDGEAQQAHSAASAIIERPIIIKRRGREARIIVGGNTPARQPDAGLINLLGRAHTYLQRLTDGSVGSIAELADQIGVHRADISRVLPLAFLSPAITVAILTGRQPAEMTARSLSRLVDVPASWNEQAQLLTA